MKPKFPNFPAKRTREQDSLCLTYFLPPNLIPIEYLQISLPQIWNKFIKETTQKDVKNKLIKQDQQSAWVFNDQSCYF